MKHVLVSWDTAKVVVDHINGYGTEHFEFHAEVKRSQRNGVFLDSIELWVEPSFYLNHRFYSGELEDLAAEAAVVSETVYGFPILWVSKDAPDDPEKNYPTSVLMQEAARKALDEFCPLDYYPSDWRLDGLHEFFLERFGVEVP